MMERSNHFCDHLLLILLSVDSSWEGTPPHAWPEFTDRVPTLISHTYSIMLSSVAALSYTPAMAPAARAAPVSMMARPAGGKAELEALAEAQQIPMGFWDPLGLADKDFWGQGNEATIGFLRHAEIKHGS